MKKLLLISLMFLLVFGIAVNSGLVSAEGNDSEQECREITGTCCLGDVCSEVTLSCLENYSQSFQGCDDNCTVIAVCIENETNETDDDDEEIEDDEEETDNEESETEVCHIPPGNPGNAHTIEVGSSAVRAHLAHGDYVGECGEESVEEEQEVEIEEDLEIEIEEEDGETKVKIRLSNQERRELKISIKEARKIAHEELKGGNLTKIELKESTHNNIPRVVYHIESDKQGKFLGIFKFTMKVSTDVDSETGEVIVVSKPWWAFLVAEQDEELANCLNYTYSNCPEACQSVCIPSECGFDNETNSTECTSDCDGASSCVEVVSS